MESGHLGSIFDSPTESGKPSKLSVPHLTHLGLTLARRAKQALVLSWKEQSRTMVWFLSLRSVTADLETTASVLICPLWSLRFPKSI